MKVTSSAMSMKAMKIFFLLVLVPFCVSLGDSNEVSPSQPLENKQNIQPTPYPEAFSILFWTNITASDRDDEGYEWKKHVVSGTQFYDWSIPAQRIDHDAGAYECSHFYQTTSKCSLIFTKAGMMRILPTDNKENGDSDCCMDIPNLGPPPPTWAQDANATYQGMVWNPILGRMAHEWYFDSFLNHQDIKNDPLPFHTSQEVALGDNRGAPLVFSFPGKANGTQDFYYRVESLQVGHPHADLFQVPSGCEQRLCGSKKGKNLRVESTRKQ